MESVYFDTLSYQSRKKSLTRYHNSLQVIVNSLCPGLVRTDLIRSVVKHSLLMSYLVPLYFAMLSKSPEYGVRLYAIAGCSAPQDHGRFFISLFNNAEYQKQVSH